MQMPRADLNDTAVIILNYSGAADTIACIDSLMRMNESVDCYVVDNRSPDDSVERIRCWGTDLSNTHQEGLPQPYVFSEYEARLDGRPGDDWRTTGVVGGNIFLIRSVHNGGYSYGNNVGLRYAMLGNYRYFWILNNDTEVDHEALYWLKQRISTNPAIEMCGSKLVYHSRRELVQTYGGASFSRWRGHATAIGSGADTSAEVDERAVEAQLSFVNGASTLVTRRFLDRVGLMEESYFLYWEELDWALRRPEGMKLGFSKRSVVYHKVGSSIGTNDFAEPTKFVDFLFVRNRILVCLRLSKISVPYALISTFRGMAQWIQRRKVDRAVLLMKAIASAFKIFSLELVRTNADHNDKKV